MEFFLHKNATPDGLTAAGFSHQYRNKYTLRKNLYKDSIYIIIYIDLDEPKETIEWYVMDAYKAACYDPFYYNPNQCRNLVLEKVQRQFKKLITDLKKRELLYKKKEGDNTHEDI